MRAKELKRCLSLQSQVFSGLDESTTPPKQPLLESGQATNAVPLNKLLLHYFGYGNIKKMKVPRQLQKGQLNRAKLSPQAVQ
jgi:hypothetical protein